MKGNRFLLGVLLLSLVVSLSAKRDMDVFYDIVEKSVSLINQDRKNNGLEPLIFKGVSTNDEIKKFNILFYLSTTTPGYYTEQDFVSILGDNVRDECYNSAVIFHEEGDYYFCLFRDVSILFVNQDAFEAEVVRLVNIEREKRGIKPLIVHEDLCFTARVKAEEFVVYNYCSHYSPKSGSVSRLVKSRNNKFYCIGENIAQGQITPEEVMNDWMNSPGHKENILDSDYEYICVGYYQDNWVQQFAKKQ